MAMYLTSPTSCLPLPGTENTRGNILCKDHHRGGTFWPVMLPLHTVSRSIHNLNLETQSCLVHWCWSGIREPQLVSWPFLLRSASREIQLSALQYFVWCRNRCKKTTVLGICHDMKTLRSFFYPNSCIPRKIGLERAVGDKLMQVSYR